MKKLFLPFILSLASVSGYWYFRPHSDAHVVRSGITAAKATEDPTIKKLNQHVPEARSYTQKHKFNSKFCFLIDMSVHAGTYRFFIYNLETNTIEQSGLVAHGRCKENWLEGRRYSNELNCGCSSLGKYRIGGGYMGTFGKAFKLHGLDSTNSNAFARYVVLHAHSCVPAKPVYPSEICQSDGCPTVSTEFLNILSAKIESSKKPVLLWIYQ